ncbi:Ca-activated chloride channel family protein [Lysobacter niastensis]|uniref:Ca-activated chloride channel family protein n=1 Tax=Lysobacter niastensis TaxID=380629 RepID=A0ABU1W833_9GAMM|nr:VWA domain-containing protein [Lysobacter niastensis]MDR7133614.1 Ca-activated chloride channel family protein [Lysobacter niastensis]
MSMDFSALHLLRPHFLWALLALPLLAAWWRGRRLREGVWQSLVDPHLLPHLLEKKADRRSRVGFGLTALAYGLSVLALAGPSWRQGEQPLWQTRTPLVVALDLSGAALASDLPPSRLAQARAKIATLLRERQGGQVALVAYAGDAFTVAPLTDDAGNVALFLDALAPEVMPVDGQRGDRAIAWSSQLLRQAGFASGQILLMTDHADDAARVAAGEAARAGYRVSVIGLGSEEGASYRRMDGSIDTARLDASSLRALSGGGGGRYSALTPDDADIRALGVLEPGIDDADAKGGPKGRVWRDEGYWLLPPLMLLALFAFRRRGAAALVVLCFVLPWQPARAVEWWQRDDQAAHSRLERGTKAYRAGDYAGAAQTYQSVDSADAHYNRGNALAKAGAYPQAIDAYDEALKREPGMADAIANKRAVEAAMKRKPPSGQSGQQNPQSSKGGQSQPSQGQGAQAKPQTGQQKDRSQAQQQPQTPSQDQSKATPADAKAQQAADAAQRERMQRALQQGKPQAGDQRSPARPANETPQQRERRLANEAWLRRVPDDPGSLLREKFRLEHERRQLRGSLEE